MEILLVTTSYPETADGREAAGSFVADFAGELARHARVTVVAPGREEATWRDGTLSVRRFAAPRLPLSLLRPGRPDHWPAILRTLRRGRAAVEAAVATGAPDHLFALWALPSGHWARAAAAPRGIPYSTWSLGSDIWSLAHLPVVGRVLAGVLRDARHRFADGYVLARDVEHISGAECLFLPSARRLPEVPARSPAAAPPYRLAFLGRWHANKGVDLLLEALARLGEEDWRRIAEVRVCGGGPLEGEVRAACTALAAAGRPVEVGGYLDRDEAARLYAWADWLLLPSRIESIPVLFSDAAQAGRPLVASPVGDLPRLFAAHPVGVLATGVSATGLAAALSEALRRPPAAFTAALAGARDEFSVPAAVERFLDTAAGG